MERRELERPSSGEAYVSFNPKMKDPVLLDHRGVDIFRGCVMRDGHVFKDSPSMPVQPVWVGFGVKNEKT